MLFQCPLQSESEQAFMATGGKGIGLVKDRVALTLCLCYDTATHGVWRMHIDCARIFIVCKNNDYSSIAVSPSSCSLSTCVSSVLTSQPFPRSVACIGFTYPTAKLYVHHSKFHHISHHDSPWQESRTHGRILQQQQPLTHPQYRQTQLS